MDRQGVQCGREPVCEGYISTRGGMAPRSFTDILIGGLAPDGGLVVPEQYPRVDSDTLESWRGLAYPQLAARILRRFASDIEYRDLEDLCQRSYTAAIFADADITPVKHLQDDQYLLRLSNGPTLAFKDIAMQLLGNLFEYVLEQQHQTLNILGATSGDTGSSAEYAMLGKSNISVFMLSPDTGMSPFQQAQMYSLDEPNIFNIAIRGVFDDCQDIVKTISSDIAFKQRYRIGAVNSINWARVAAQVVYYFKGWLAVTNRPGQLVSFAVPSGNFGNVCAGHIARQMGLPVRHLVVATNENDVLDEFFRSGAYRPRPAAQVQRTSSPSMDISKASNFERFVFDLVDRDPEALRQLWTQLGNEGSFDLAGSQAFERVAGFGFVSGRSSHDRRIRTIRTLHESLGVLVDTHTADGIAVGSEYVERGVPMLFLETAQPVKFEQAIREAVGWCPPRPEGLEDLERRPQHVQTMDADSGQVRSFLRSHIMN